jgi:ribosomal subunit interface protein
MSLRVHFHDVPQSDDLRSEAERHVAALQQEFPATSKFEVSLSRDRAEHHTHVHLTGKEGEFAAHAANGDPRASLEAAFTRLRRQLRRHHDKRVLGRRRQV